MIRALDTNHDWTFGANLSNYLLQNEEIGLNIETRVLSFLGDCFFATTEGIDWFNLLDYRYQPRLELSVSEVIKNTPGVTAINSVDVLIGQNRKITLNYDIQTQFSQSYINSITPIQL